jgi:hypothetical protein
MAKGASSKAVVVLLLVGVCGVGALALYVKSDPLAAKVPVDMRRTDDQPAVKVERPTVTTGPIETPRPAKQTESVLIPSFAGGQVGSEMAKQDVPEGKDPKVFLAEEIVKGAKIENARVLGVDVHNGTAVINFADGIDTGMGSDQEALFITALQKGYGQFPEVSKLEIDKEGQPLESVGGHIDLTDGLTVTRPGSSDVAPKPSAP